MKTLVAYFSASGTTEGVAKKVAEEAGADPVSYTHLDVYKRQDMCRSGCQ